MNTKMARHSGTAAEVKLGKAEASSSASMAVVHQPGERKAGSSLLSRAPLL